MYSKSHFSLHVLQGKSLRVSKAILCNRSSGGWQRACQVRRSPSKLTPHATAACYSRSSQCMPGCCPTPAPPECWGLPAAGPGTHAYMSEASKLFSKIAGADLFPACTGLTCKRWQSRRGAGPGGGGRTSAFTPRSPICAAAHNTFSAEHATAHDRKYPHRKTLSCEYCPSRRRLHSSYSLEQCKTAQHANKPFPLTTHACRSTREAPRQTAPCTASPNPVTATAYSSSQRHHAICELAEAHSASIPCLMSNLRSSS